MFQKQRKYSARLMCGAAAGALVMFAGMAHAQDAERIEIEAQPLAKALGEFAAKTKRAVLVTPDLTASRTSRGVAGEMQPEAALVALLDGTGLTYRRDGDTFLIVKAAGPQSSGAAGGGAEVAALIVTAQKREEDIQDVPIAISAFTQEDLTRSQIAGGPDLMTQVPNMTFTKTNFSSYSIQIRGIGTQAISATVDPAVAVAFNNTPFTRNRFFEQEFYDLERVEVLRGPQGTLYGRNATAGVVNLLSARPTFRLESKLSGDIANYSSSRLEGMVNIPLVEDVIALRLAGAWTKREGFATNQLTDRQIDGRDLWSTRLSLRVEPTDRLSIDLVWEHFEEDDDRLRSGKQLCKKDPGPESIGGVDVPDPTYGGVFDIVSFVSQGCLPASLYADESFQTPNGFALPFYGPTGNLNNHVRMGTDPYASATQSRDLRVIESTLEPEYRAKADIAQLRVSIDITPTFTITSETAYSTDFVFALQDYNRFNTKPGAFEEGALGIRPGLLSPEGVFCDPQLGCSDRLLLGDLSTAKSAQFSQEFRISSDYEGAFNFSLGANFLRYDTEDKYYVFINSLSMFAADQWGAHEGRPYIPGVSDNGECLLNGVRPGDPRVVHPITYCIYIDPNPIDSLNDQGHNYFLSRNPYRLISYATFGEAYLNLTDTLKLTGGFRWTVDKKRAPLIPSWLLASHTVGYPVAEVVVQEWSEPTGRLTVDWKPRLDFTDETLFYASYAHGYKAGGANPPPPVVAAYLGGDGAATVERLLTHPKTFDPEFIDAFEAGAKNTLFDGRMTLNVNAFYYDYKGYQISQIVNRSAVNLNFDAKVWGAELEASWRPLENLRIGLKAGYQQTRMADGSRAIDLMDRTAGDPDYVLFKAFPTIPSNCIVPVSFLVQGGEFTFDAPNDVCVSLYYENQFPEVAATVPNNGEGIFKGLSGNELPNAPNFTGTLTLDYTLPVGIDWLLTLHGDVYGQSEAWTRVFNTEGYDKLKAYNNINFAAIFNNEAAGLQVMAYMKNVLDRDSITGAFLNSDDTGLTTNVFLTEPRLYGIRVTKNWTGVPLLGDRLERRARASGASYPFTLELGGGFTRLDAPGPAFSPAFVDEFDDFEFPLDQQQQSLDWGDARSFKLTYSPGNDWSVTTGVRYGKANGSWNKFVLHDEPGGNQWGEGSYFPDKYTYLDHPGNYASTRNAQSEHYTLVDFMVGRDVALGSQSESSLSLGIGYADFGSESSGNLAGMPNFYLPPANIMNYNSDFYRYSNRFSISRTFKGAGPQILWEGSQRFLGSAENGQVGADWSVSVGVLFGRQKEDIRSSTDNRRFGGFAMAPALQSITTTPFERSESRKATVPTAALSLGVSYEIGGVKAGAGYSWERYFGVIGSGIDEGDHDRTIDGPYFKLAIGFGG